MSFLRLLVRNLLFHRRGNLAVLLGVAIGTAVLTGALLVGDSLRGSLRELTLRRLSWVDETLIGARFFPTDLAGAVQGERVSPALLLRATASAHDGNETARSVTLMGVDARFGLETPGSDFWQGSEDKVVLGHGLAERLKVKVGERVDILVQQVDEVPRESLLGKRGVDDAFLVLRLTVAAVLGPDDFASRFSLNPTPEAPRNAYVPLAYLQKQLGQPGRANAILVGAPTGDPSAEVAEALTLDAWGLQLWGARERAADLIARFDRDGDGRLGPREWFTEEKGKRKPRFAAVLAEGINPGLGADTIERPQIEEYYRREHPYVSLQSRQLLLEPPVARAALEAAKDSRLRAAPTLVYLARFQPAGAKEKSAGVLAALDPTLPPPLGPFLPDGKTSLADNEIVLATDRPLDSPDLLKPGTEIVVSYKPPEHGASLADLTATFKLAGYVSMTGPRADPALTPDFPGITDKENPAAWKLPFKDDDWEKNIRKEYGDDYWDRYRATPKGYITLAAGQKLWGSRFGDVTSIRLVPDGDGTLDAAHSRFNRALLKRLDRQRDDFSFLPVKADALAASVGGTDFAQLFLGFSFFLILSALLLVVLLFRLNLDRRAYEIGLLMASGYRRSTVRWLLLGEGALLSLVGVAVGLGLAIIYSTLLVRFLGAIWPGGTLKSFLQPHLEARSLGIGAGASLLASLLSILWALRALSRVSPRDLLGGRTGDDLAPPGRVRWSWWIAGAALLLAPGVMALAAVVKGHEAQAGAFFGSGALLLTALLAALSGWMRGSRHHTVEGAGASAVARLGVRNAARHPGRSLLTAGLLASAAFLLVAVEAFRRHPGSSTGPDATDGGFAVVAETDLPVYLDDRGEIPRTDLVNQLEPRYRRDFSDGTAEALSNAEKLLDQCRIVPVRVREGDDASCLNLYQPRQPRIFGVPQSLIDRGGFSFASTQGGGTNPWKLLDDPKNCFGEKNTVVWMLKKGLGENIDVTDGNGEPRSLTIAGLLQDSVFQSGLLVSQHSFEEMYPRHKGYHFFLVQTPPGKEKEVQAILQIGLADRGAEVELSAKKLESYLAVENTYLSTFQALGGLGLVLGTLGLGIVLLRGVWERRAELALLRALGYRRRVLGWLVLAENGFLLLVGLGAGTLAALAAVAPHVLTGGGRVAWLSLVVLLGLAFVVGLLASTAATAATVRAALIPALRRE